jgi:ubiquinone/menaquinone biosynthesis C-methylase UbiE
MTYWHEISPKKYGLFEKFNHSFPVNNCRQGGRVLEIGAGLGEHILYENLNQTEYYALDIRPEMAGEIKKRFPGVKVIIGDCQKHMEFPDNYFDRIVAIHVLEHLTNLPAALKEICRILKPDGEFCVVLPCEDGLAHKLARIISAKRIFEKRYRINYDRFIQAEHINNAFEVMEELNLHFNIKKRSYFPLRIPIINLNLAIGMVLKPEVKTRR